MKSTCLQSSCLSRENLEIRCTSFRCSAEVEGVELDLGLLNVRAEGQLIVVSYVQVLAEAFTIIDVHACSLLLHEDLSAEVN